MDAISVAICCCNNEATIGPALDSVRWADDLVVVDSGSTDRTVEIARRYTDRVFTEPWRGYSAQKQLAVAHCRHDWVLVLDSDEEVSPKLARQIQALDPARLEDVDVVHMKRRHYLLGRRARAWSPDWQSRLIHRDRAVWTHHALHEDRRPSAPGRMLKLSGHLEHKRAGPPDFADYFSGRRLDARLLPVAEQMHARGRRCRWWDLALRPPLTFLKLFILKRGFLDGTFGLMVAQKTAQGVQLKYAALWAVQHRVHRPDARP